MGEILGLTFSVMISKAALAMLSLASPILCFSFFRSILFFAASLFRGNVSGIAYSIFPLFDFCSPLSAILKSVSKIAGCIDEVPPNEEF